MPAGIAMVEDAKADRMWTGIEGERRGTRGESGGEDGGRGQREGRRRYSVTA
jgi:hypothetical protein